MLACGRQETVAASTPSCLTDLLNPLRVAGKKRSRLQRASDSEDEEGNTQDKDGRDGTHADEEGETGSAEAAAKRRKRHLDDDEVCSRCACVRSPCVSAVPIC